MKTKDLVVSEAPSRYVRSFLLSLWEEASRELWSPPADVFKTAEGWILKLDIAGVRPKDVRVSASANTIRVEGFRQDLRPMNCQHECMEISYSYFERSFELPNVLQNTDIQLQYEDGMLYIHVKESANG